MASYFNGYNASVLTIPVYFILSFLPHALAVNLATRGNLVTWDNRSPRSSDMKAQLKQRLPAETYAKYERMEACHANGMENLPLFVGAVVLGNMARTVAYVTTSTQALTLVRSGLWVAGVSLCFRTIIRAAGAMATDVSFGSRG